MLSFHPLLNLCLIIFSFFPLIMPLDAIEVLFYPYDSLTVYPYPLTNIQGSQLHSTPTTCPACFTPCATEERICATCGLLFASYAPAASNTVSPQVAAFTYVPLIPGRWLANGRFTVRQALSKGGMGAIYLASDNEAFGRLVVVKA